MHGYSLVILLHLFRIPFYQNTCGRLILVTEMKPTGPKILFKNTIYLLVKTCEKK